MFIAIMLILLGLMQLTNLLLTFAIMSHLMQQELKKRQLKEARKVSVFPKRDLYVVYPEDLKKSN